MALFLSLFLLPPSSFLLSQEPLPDFEWLREKTRANLARSERVQHLFAFKERRTDIHTNPFGRLGTGGTRVFEVYPSATRGLTYRRVIQRNGVPVSAAELMEQDRNYRARVAEVQSRTASRSEEERRQRQRDEEERRRRAEATIEDVVGTLQFKVTGRAMRDGVQTIVVTFTPRPGARPTTRQGRIAEKFAGTVWIHEQAAEVMRIEAKAIDNLSFGFGIVARLSEGTSAVVVRKPIDGDVWMPTELRLKGEGRAALFRRLVIDYAVDWFDYRRLPEGSAAPFLNGGH
jgi:hypothetical protein